MCLIGGHGQCLGYYQNNKRQVLMTLKLYMILMFMERWRPAAGCGDCGLVDWKDSSEGAEDIEVGKRFRSKTMRAKKE